MRTVHIHARDIVRHDAVGNFCRQLFDLTAAGGWRPALWAEHGDSVEGYPVGSREEFFDTVRPGEAIFFNHSIFDPILSDVAALPNPKLYYFHNVTPPELIDPEDEATVVNCREGLAQRGLAARFGVLMANSTESAEVLLAGMAAPDRARWQGRIAAIPPIVGLDRWPPSAGGTTAQSDSARHLLFVGRLVPHKGLHTLMDVFERLTFRVPHLTLDIVGGPQEGGFVADVKRLADAVNARGRGRVLFHHGVSDESLRELYERAAALLTFSRHEGFCVPIVDALVFDKPGLTSALPTLMETAGGAALPVSDLPEDAAGQIAAFLEDPSAQAVNAAARRVRLGQLRDLCDGRAILATLESLS